MNENDLLLRAKEERDEIFERYDKGRDGDSLINSWEETKFEVYHRADRLVPFFFLFFFGWGRNKRVLNQTVIMNANSWT